MRIINLKIKGFFQNHADRHSSVCILKTWLNFLIMRERNLALTNVGQLLSKNFCLVDCPFMNPFAKVNTLY